MAWEAASVNRSIKNLPEQRWKSSYYEIYSSDALLSHWHDIATALHLPQNYLSEIERRFKDNNHRFFVVIFRCFLSRKEAVAMKNAVTQLNNPLSSELFDVYYENFQRIYPQAIGYTSWYSSVSFVTWFKSRWLHKVDFKSTFLPYIHVSEDDLPDIYTVLMEHCPIRWYEIGMMVQIPKAVLDTIDRDAPDTRRKLIEMVSTWINARRKNTWQDLIDAINKVEMIKVKFAAEYPNIGPLNETSYQSLANELFVEQQKNESLQKRDSALRGLHRLLNVDGGVSNDDLIVNLGIYIRQANLRREDIQEVVRELEMLEGSMSQYSTTLREWAADLKADLNTAWDVRGRLVDRRQKLERLLHNLNRNRDFMPQDLGDKLRYVYEEIEESIMELDRANADYETISDKLNKCQIELEASMEEYQKFHVAIKSCKYSTMKDALQTMTKDAVDMTKDVTSAGNTGGGYVGRVLGGDFGAAAGGAIGTVLGGVLGISVGLLIVTSGLPVLPALVWAQKVHDVVYGPLPEWNEQFQRLLDSSYKELQESRCELQAIQEVLNKARHPFRK